jgi:hypothetical protein
MKSSCVLSGVWYVLKCESSTVSMASTEEEEFELREGSLSAEE